MRPLGSSTHGWPALANLAWLVFVCALGGSAPAAACSSSQCDLNGADVTITSLSGSATYTNSATGTNAILTNQGASSTFAGVIVDGGPTATIGLTQDSTTGGTLTLTGANTYTGGTTIAAGTLQIGDGATTGSIVGNVTNNSALVFDRADNVTFGGAISGTGSVAQQGGGVLTLTATNTYTGGTTIAAGTVRADAVNTLGSGGVTFAGPGALEANVPTVTTAVTINNGASATLGAIAGNTLTLTGSFAVPVTGFFTTIQFGSAADTGTVALDTAPTSSFSGVGAVIAGGTVKIGSLAASGFLGSMQAGLTVGSSGVAATLDLGAALNPEVFNLSGNANGVITDTAGSTTLTTVNNLTSSTYAGVIKDGAGAVSLNVINFSGLALTLSNSGGNTYSGTTTIESGATLLGGATNAFSAASATTLLAGATLDLGGFNQTVSSLAGSGTVTNSATSAAVLTNQGASSTFSGVIQDGASKVGLNQESATGATLNLGGHNTYSGPTMVTKGELQATVPDAFSPNSPVTIGALGNLDLHGFNQTVSSLAGVAGGSVSNDGSTPATLTNQGASSIFFGVLQDEVSSLGLIQNSAGHTLTLAGADTNTGPTTVQAGTLMGGAINAFSAVSATTVDAGGTLDLGGLGLTQTINTVNLAGGVVQNGTLTSLNGITSTGGTIDGIGGTTALTVKSGVTTLKTTTGGNTYTGGTTINGGTLLGGAANAFSAAAGIVVAAGGVLDLGGFAQTTHVTLNGGVVQHGALMETDVLIDAASGTVDGLGGTAGLDARGGFGGGVVTLNTTTGANTYTGETDVNGIASAATLRAGAANAFSPNSVMIVGGGFFPATLDLGGFDQTVSSLSGFAGSSTSSAVVTNNGTSAAILTNQGGSSTFHAVIQDGVSPIGLTQNSPGNTLTLAGANTYSGPTTVQAGTLMGGAANAFSAASVTTVNAGGTLDLGGLGLTQTINTVNLAGGVVENGTLTSVNGIASTGGTVDGIGGGTGLTVNSGVTTLKTTTGGNTYAGATTINGGTLLGGVANAFSAASPTTVNPGGTLDLGGLGLTQTINSVTLAGGVIQNGTLKNANGITSSGGTLKGVTVSTSGTDGHALRVGGSGSQVNLVGANTFTTQGAGAIGLYAKLGGVISAPGATNITTSGSGAYGVNADGAGGQIKLGSANVATAGSGAFGLFASDASASGVAGSISATGTLNVTTTNPAATAIGLQGNGASILATGGGMIASAGDAIEFLGGTNQAATFDSFNISTSSGDIVFADPSMATITFNNSTVDAGTGYLLDATGGSAITFNASASTLTGAMATDAVSKSNVNLTNGTVWNLTGPSKVSSLAVTNSVVAFAPPGAGGSFKTLTVNNYVGSGANIVLNTALGGSSSPTDRIVVSGGSATGNTLLTIRNAGGVGAQTTGAGIPIVITTSGGTTASDAFALANTPVVNGHRYALDDSGGDWYLVSSPTTTLAQVQSSLNAVSKAQLGQIVNNGLLSSILLGATQQVSCSNCASGFGALGSFALGTQGRVGLSDRLAAIGGFSYNQWSSSGISVYDAPTFAGSLLYDFDNFGSSRPFVEAGGSLTPYESIHGSRVYPNGLTMATGNWTSLDRNLSLFARAGWVARLTPIDEAAAYADLGRNWLQTGGYTEATTATNPFPASAASALQGLNTARLGAQYTHLFTDNIEVNVSGAVAHGFGAGGGFVVNVTDFGPIGPTALPTTTWFEYGARVGYRLSDSLVVDAFVLGAVGGEVGSTVHGGMALRVAF